MSSPLPPEREITLLRTMLLMRRLEEQVLHFAEEYHGLLRGHFHVYIGQEATGAGACAAATVAAARATSAPAVTATPPRRRALLDLAMVSFSTQ